MTTRPKQHVTLHVGTNHAFVQPFVLVYIRQGDCVVLLRPPAKERWQGRRQKWKRMHRQTKSVYNMSKNCFARALYTMVLFLDVLYKYIKRKMIKQ